MNLSLMLILNAFGKKLVHSHVYALIPLSKNARPQWHLLFNPNCLIVHSFECYTVGEATAS